MRTEARRGYFRTHEGIKTLCLSHAAAALLLLLLFPVPDGAVAACYWPESLKTLQYCPGQPLRLLQLLLVLLMQNGLRAHVTFQRL